MANFLRNPLYCSGLWEWHALIEFIFISQCKLNIFSSYIFNFTIAHSPYFSHQKIFKFENGATSHVQSPFERELWVKTNLYLWWFWASWKLVVPKEKLSYFTFRILNSKIFRSKQNNRFKNSRKSVESIYDRGQNAYLIKTELPPGKFYYRYAVGKSYNGLKLAENHEILWVWWLIIKNCKK